MKKIVCLFISCVLLASPAMAQSKTEKVIKNGTKVAGALLGLLGSVKASADSGNDTEEPSLTKTSEGETIQMDFVDETESYSSADPQMKIVTNSPYLKVSVTKCEANGKTVILEMKMVNISGNDADHVRIWAGNIKVYDDQGNVYGATIKVANGQFTDYMVENDYLADVPVKVAIKIENVSTIAESLARVTLAFDDHGILGLNRETPVTLRNIPITRQ